MSPLAPSCAMLLVGRFAVLVFALLGSSAPLAQSITVIDDDRREITLARPATRIVSLAPSLTELLYAAGAGDKLVGASEYSNYPPEAMELPIVGRFDLINTEAILALRPDLVVAWRTGNPRAAVQRLSELGLTVYIAEPTTLDSIPDHIDRLALLAGTQEEGNLVSADFRSLLGRLRREHGDREPVSVFYQVWNEPLISVGGNELINDIISVCGGRNIFAELGVAPKIEVEAVLERNPEVIIASGVNGSRPAWLDDWRRWPQVRAVEENHLYDIPPDLVQRHTPRALTGATQMCEHLDRVRASR